MPIETLKNTELSKNNEYINQKINNNIDYYNENLLKILGNN